MIKRIYILAGPTAAGKTDIALRIAEKLDAWIISADSRQVYRGMDIGTAKPSKSDRAMIKHFLLDVIDPDSVFSAGEFLTSALDIIKSAQQQNRNILVVGGTGLYIRALVKGFNLAGTPKIDDIRNELDERLKTCGLENLVEELNRLDSNASESIDLKNPRRVIRALEIVKATGKPLDQSRGSNERDDFNFAVIGLRRDREELRERIQSRINLMIESGWIDEVRNLASKNYDNDSPAMTGIGYKELREHLDGIIDLDLAVERINIRTRQYAKRQMTWFNADDYIRWFDLNSHDDIESVSERILHEFVWN